MLLPQGLCTHCSFCHNAFYSTCPHDLLPYLFHVVFSVAYFMTTQFKNYNHLTTLLSSFPATLFQYYLLPFEMLYIFLIVYLSFHSLKCKLLRLFCATSPWHLEQYLAYNSCSIRNCWIKVWFLNVGIIDILNWIILCSTPPKLG